MCRASELVARDSSLFRSMLPLLSIWQLAIWLFEPPRYILPGPIEIAGAIARNSNFLIHNSLITITETLVGLLAGSILGVVTALAITALPRVGSLIWPLLLILQAFPVFVLAPILVLWFGFGMTSKIVMTTLIIFFPVTSSFTDGIRRTDEHVLDAASLTKASHFQTLLHLRAPLALPSLISGLKIGATLAPLGAVIGEWVGASAGLGFVMIQANARMQTDVTFAAMSIIALMTISLRHGVDQLTKSLAPWSREIEPTTLSPQSNRTKKCAASFS